MGRAAWLAFGVALITLAIGFTAVQGHLEPRGAFSGGMAIMAGVFLPSIARDTEAISARIAGRSMQKVEILGLLIFILMAFVMFMVGTALFVDWLGGSGTTSGGIVVDPGLFPGVSGVAGAMPIMNLVIGVEVVGGLSLIALYMLPGFRRGR